MAIPNINQLTAQLRMMPDQALQRFAQLHKNDPYILPMVVAEDAARKEMRQAAQAQMAQMAQAQPKVVDQALMRMGPQPQAAPGLAALQAPNMETMSDGGIAGYADGGDVVMSPGSTPSYQRTDMSPGMLDFAQRSEPVVRMSDGGVARYQVGGQLPIDTAPTFYSQQLQSSTDPLVKAHREAYTFEVERLAAEKDIAAAEQILQRYGQRQRQTDPEGYARAVAARDDAVKRRDAAAKRYSAESERLAPVDESERAYKKPSAATSSDVELYKNLYPKEPPKAPMMPIPDIQVAGVPAKGSGTAQTGAPPAAAKPGAATPESGLYSLTGRLFEPVEDATMRRLRYAQIAAQQRGEEERAEFEAGKPKEKRFAGLEGLLKKQEEGEAADKETAKAMAIFNAGLAMMAGGSPYALQNIAKGAMVGTGEYAGALKEFKQAAKERMKMQADIEDARRAEERDDRKTALTLMQRANDRQDKLDEHIADAGMKLGLSRAEITGRLYGTQMETESRERTARAHDPLAVMRALSVPGPMREGYTFMQQAKAEPMTRQKLFLEYTKNPMNDPAKFGDYVKEYERQFGPLGSVSGAASQSADEALVNKWLNPPR